MNEWRRTINASDSEWPLLIVNVLAMLYPGMPTPILQIQGEQGSAKSSACVQIRSLIDPNSAPLKTEPQQVQDLYISALNSGILVYDNLSKLSAWLSDALCRMTTGGGFSTRKLYGNTEETIFEAMRPVIVNGITDLSPRSDLLDRMVTITFPAIPEHQRRTSVAVMSEFEKLRPRLFGALLDALSATLRNLPGTKVDNLPRMADFTQFGAAAETSLGLPAGSFLNAYRQNRASNHAVALEATPIAQALLNWMTDQKSWTGFSSEILSNLDQYGDVPEKQRRGQHWPSCASQLTATLKRIVPNLRENGLVVAFGERRRNGILIDIKWHNT